MDETSEIEVDETSIDQLLRAAEVRAEEDDSVGFNKTNEDYTIVFGRSYRYDPE